METTDRDGKNVSAAFLLRIVDEAARRIVDVSASTVGFVFLFPIFLVIAIFIKRDSPGPIFYFGPRLGKKGKCFNIIKFRTMYECEESYSGPRITATDDSRVTPFGRWLRDTKINELPQLWNVFKGDMALVGPRPEDPEIAKSWPDSLRDDLLSVRPGITSPATVLFRQEEDMLHSDSVMDDYLKTILPDKLRIDRSYIHSRSLLTDLDVIFMTMLLLLPRLRNTDVPVTSLYWGPIAKFASRSLNWFLIDTVTAFLAMGMAAFLWRLSAPFDIGLIVWIFIAVAVGLGFSVINSALGLTRIQWRRAPAREVIPLAFSCFCATLLLIYMDTFVLLHTQLPLAMLALTGLFSFSGFTFTRYRERLVTGFASFWLSFRGTSGMAGERVLLVGAGNNSQLAIWFLTHSDYQRLFSIVGIVDDDPRKQGLCFDGYQVIGTSRDLCELVEKHRVDLTLFTITNIDSGERQRILNTCQGTRARVVIFPDVMANLASYFQPPRSQPSALQNANYTEAIH